MTVDRTLVSKVSMARARNVYTRAERIELLKKSGRIQEGRAIGLPKTRVEKVVKKVKEKKKEAVLSTTKTTSLVRASIILGLIMTPPSVEEHIAICLLPPSR